MNGPRNLVRPLIAGALVLLTLPAWAPAEDAVQVLAPADGATVVQATDALTLSPLPQGFRLDCVIVARSPRTGEDVVVGGGPEFVDQVGQLCAGSTPTTMPLGEMGTPDGLGFA